MQVLVTGGTGDVGRAAMRRLVGHVLSVRGSVWFVVELLYTLDNLFRPCGSTLKFTLFQRTFGAFDEKAFR